MGRIYEISPPLYSSDVRALLGYAGLGSQVHITPGATATLRHFDLLDPQRVPTRRGRLLARYYKSRWDNGPRIVAERA